MKISLIICTYMRPKAICVLLDSIVAQRKVPDEIIIIDGSLNDETREILTEKKYDLPIRYFLVGKEDRGLTRQRNYGVERVNAEMDVVAFLDDDIRLDENYFYEILQPYAKDAKVIAVGGCTTNEVKWEKYSSESECPKGKFCIDGYIRNESLRYRLRNVLGLVPSTQPGLISLYSHERSVGYLPPSDKYYTVDFMMGGIASFKKELFDKIGFSHYFEGYGLYEDKDFTLRAREFGTLIVNTKAKLEHLHDPNGRPNKFYYGQMVIRNGWYVWQVATPNSGVEGVLKWYINACVLITIRFTNILTGPKRMEALTETLGRVYGLFTLVWDKPKVQK